MRRQGGFTLIELSVVLSMLTVLTVSALQFYKTRVIDETLVKATAIRYKTLRDSSLRYRADTGSWPVAIATLTGGGYLPATSTTTPWGSAFTLTVSGSDLDIGIPTGGNNFAVKVMRYVPNGTRTGPTVTDTLVPPGQEASNSMLYARDGSNGPLLANLDANGNSIVAANNITATGTVSANQVTASGIVSGNQVTASADMRAPLYYDSNNTAYYTNPASTSRVSRIDAVSQMRAPIYYDSNNTAYYLNPASTSRVSRIDAVSQMRAPILYDSNNTAYYLNPNGTSVLYRPKSLRTPTAANDVANKAYVDSKGIMSGTLCGISYYGCTMSAHSKAYKACGGYNPRYSCPSGYTRKIEFEGNACGQTKLARCVKN